MLGKGGDEAVPHNLQFILFHFILPDNLQFILFYFILFYLTTFALPMAKFIEKAPPADPQ
jgi:hypothetical protein